MMKKSTLGSKIAKAGFQNEKDIADKFNNWKKEKDAQSWLKIMGYLLEEIKEVKAIILSGFKTDIQVKIVIKLKYAIAIENLQVKLINNLKGFNQVDKRWVDKYSELWSIPKNISTLLKKYTGEISPTIKNPIDKRRTFAHEFNKKNQAVLLQWLAENKILIINDILKGRGKLSAEWMLVIQKIDEKVAWVLEPINIVLNYFGNGEVLITKRGNIKIGNITVQRKGGDNGRKTANMLQFKINPGELFLNK